MQLAQRATIFDFAEAVYAAEEEIEEDEEEDEEEGEDSEDDSEDEDEDGWYHLGGVGTRLMALRSDFDPRTYGYSKLVTLFEKTGAFDVRRDQQVVFIRPKKKPA